jgi:hypothetical protein
MAAMGLGNVFRIPRVLAIRISSTTNLAANVGRGFWSHMMIVQHEHDLGIIRLYLIRSAKETKFGAGALICSKLANEMICLAEEFAA